MADSVLSQIASLASGPTTTAALLVTLLAPAHAQFDPPSQIADLATIDVLISADLDGDGLEDVVVASWYTGGFQWYRNTGGGSFSAAIALPEPSNYDVPGALVAGDLDGDSDIDLILSTSEYDPNLGLWYTTVRLMNQGNGTFSPAMTSGSDVLCSRLADLDGDGDLDWLYIDDTNDEVLWKANDSNGLFSPRPALATSILGARSLRAADLNGDGHLDVVVADEYDSRIIWFENDGAGGFGPLQTLVSNVTNSYSLDAADLDGDLDVDVLVGSLHTSSQSGTTNGEVVWFENLGANAFAPPHVLYTVFPGGSWDVHATDVDGDGRTDVLYTRFFEATWHRGLGWGAFDAPRTIQSNSLGLRRIAAADFDADTLADVDLVTCSFNDGIIEFHRQQPSNAATGYCAGPAGTGACPCFNPGGDLEGCSNSTGRGALLEWFGSSSFAADDLAVQIHGGPAGQPGVFFQGTTSLNTPFMDGLRCVGGAIQRLRIFSLDQQGSAQITYNLASLSRDTTASDLRHYQVWYRDPLGVVCGTLSNLSSAMSVSWQ